MKRMLRIGLVLAATAAAAVFAASSAKADGGLTGALLPPCGTTSQPFAQFGDSDAYCAFPNNGFESGSSSWSLSGRASIVAANEPWYVSGPGTHALDLAPGASATSSPLPVSLIDPWVRMFAQSAGANGNLVVQVIFHGLLGNLTGILNVGSLAPGGYASWQPTQQIPSILALPLLTQTAQVRIVSQATSGDWQVDDVYLDPAFSRG